MKMKIQREMFGGRICGGKEARVDPIEFLS